MEILKDVRFNPKKGFIKKKVIEIKKNNRRDECKAMLKSDNKQIASYVLTDITLGELKRHIEQGGDVNLVLYKGRPHTPLIETVSDKRKLSLMIEEEANMDEADAYISQLAQIDRCLHRGNIDLSDGNYINNININDRWSIKVIARRSGALSDVGEYKYYPTCKETSEIVWRGKMTSLQNKGLSPEYARSYIKTGVKVPYPYADDVLSFVIHQVIEYGDLWIWHKPKSMKEMDKVIDGQVSVSTIANKARRWVAYNMLLGTLGLDPIPSESHKACYTA